MNPNNPLSRIMTTQLHSVRPDDSIQKVMEIFRQYEFHHIPVVTDGEQLVGIISREDFVRIAYDLLLLSTNKTHPKSSYRTMKVEEVMTIHPLSLEPEDTIGLAADIFMANQFHALPIVEDGRLVGLVTTHDLLRYGFYSPIENVEAEESILDRKF